MKKILILFSFLLLANVGCTVSDPEMMELLQEIKAQNDKLLQEVEAMKGQFSLLDGKYQVILASLAENKKELEALKSQIDSLKTQIAQQLIKIDQLSAQLTQQGADIVKLSAEIAELKASCAELILAMEDILANCSSPTWRKLADRIDIVGNVTPYSFDRERRLIYFLDGKTKSISSYSIDNNSIKQINTSGFPVFNLPNYDTQPDFIFNPSKNTIQFWRSGKDVVYEVSRDGGVVTKFSDGAVDETLYNSNPIYTGVTNNPAIINGYGFFSMNNTAYEVGQSIWNLKRPNSTTEPYKRSFSQVYPNNDFKKAYMIDGIGSQSGNQSENSCGISGGLPAANDIGKYCWLRDIWEIDLVTWQVKKILPLNSNFEETGSFGYDFTNNAFYSFGGFIPPATNDQSINYITKLRKFNPTKDTGWVTLETKGTGPIWKSSTVSFYDNLKKRFIIISNEEIWELKL
jgi:uncharacterized protein YoxC